MVDVSATSYRESVGRGKRHSGELSLRGFPKLASSREPTGGWEAAVTGTLETCLYTAKERRLAALFVKGVISKLGKKDVALLWFCCK
jgi:hypothetical protein